MKSLQEGIKILSELEKQRNVTELNSKIKKGDLETALSEKERSSIINQRPINEFKTIDD